MTIDRYKGRDLIFELVPDFKEFWKKEAEYGYGEDEPPYACGDMTIFSDYVDEHIVENNSLDLKAIFLLIFRLFHIFLSLYLMVHLFVYLIRL